VTRRRRVRTFGKWAGAAVTVLLLIVWAGSAWWMVRGPLTQRTHLQIVAGRVDVIRFGPKSEMPAMMPWQRLERHRMPFRWWFGTKTYVSAPIQYDVAGIPLWSLLLLTGVPTAWMFRTDWKRRRIERAGLCPKCGYDLRGLPDGRACPECGAVR
jgi:hypothetical protein